MSEQDKRHQRHLHGQERPPTAITAATEAEGDAATNLDDIPEVMKHQITANHEALLERDAKGSEAPPAALKPQRGWENSASRKLANAIEAANPQMITLPDDLAQMARMAPQRGDLAQMARMAPQRGDGFITRRLMESIKMEFSPNLSEKIGEKARETSDRMTFNAIREAEGLPPWPYDRDLPRLMYVPCGRKSRKFDFSAIYEVYRPGVQHFIDWLENETDFFTAPASTKYHGAYPGGLAEHSINVMRRLYKIAERDGVDMDQADMTITILGLLHDVCKVNVYHPTTKRRKNATTGQWEDYQTYEYRDTLPMGHGEKSVYLIQKYMELTDEEALAIRWHMGAYDNAVKGGGRELGQAMELTPWVWRLHEADMCAAWIDERKKES